MSYIVRVKLHRIVELQNKLDAMSVESQQSAAGTAIVLCYLSSYISTPNLYYWSDGWSDIWPFSKRTWVGWLLLNFPTPFLLNLCILSGQARTAHIFLYIVLPSLYSFHHRTVLGPVSIISTFLVYNTISVDLSQSPK